MRLGWLAALLAAAGAGVRADIDADQCRQDTAFIYNASFAADSARRFFSSLNVSLDGPVSQARALRALPAVRQSPLQVRASFSGTSPYSVAVQSFFEQCANVGGGWCSKVILNASWTTGDGTRILLGSEMGMCFPFSCCDGSGCDMTHGLAAVAATAASSVIFRWCGTSVDGSPGPLCPNRTGGDSLGGPGLGSVALSYAPELARSSGRRPLAEWSGKGPEPALWGGATDLVVSVRNVCMVTSVDSLMYVALGAAAVLCACGCVVVGQRVCLYRRMAALDMEPEYDEYDEAAAARRIARVARRKARAEALAFSFGEPEPVPAPDVPRKSSSRGRASGDGGDTAQSLLGAEDDDAGASATVTALVEPAADGEAPVDPISLEDIKEGDRVVRFPGCRHLFRIDSLMQWLEANDTCPVCRTAFPDDEGGPSSAAVGSDDAKAGAPADA